jgi:hypothetical protein
MPKYSYIRETYPDLFESEKDLSEQDIIDREYAKEFQHRDSEYDRLSIEWIKGNIRDLEVAEHVVLGGIVIRTE